MTDTKDDSKPTKPEDKTTQKDPFHNPHDGTFKKLMEHTSFAAEFLKIHLPLKIREAVNFKSLTPKPITFLDDELRPSASDVLFQLKIKEHTSYCFVLVEHQSQPDPWMPFRLVKYMILILDKHLKEHEDCKRLPAIYPMVFYHGQPSPYPYSTNFFDLFDDPLGFIQEIFFNHPVIDIKSYSDERIKQHGGPVASAEMAFKHIHDTDLTNLAVDIFSPLSDSKSLRVTEQIIDHLVTYIVAQGNVTNVETFLHQAAEGLTGTTKETIMTIAEQLEQKGRQEGYQEGANQEKHQIAANMLSKGYPVTDIVQMTGLPLEEVRRIEGEVQH